MKLIFAIILKIFDLVLVIAGFICLFVAKASGVTSAFTEGLLIFGLIGVGALIGSTLVFASGLLRTLSDDEKELL